jgi:hypothetical protein
MSAKKKGDGVVNVQVDEEVNESYVNEKNQCVQKCRKHLDRYSKRKFLYTVRKKCMIRACLGGVYGLSATCTYLRVHCCMRVTHSAHAV